MNQSKAYFISAVMTLSFCLSALADPFTCESGLAPATRAQLLARIREGLKDSRKMPHLQDARMLHFLEQLKAHGAVTLAVGNSTRNQRSSNLERYHELAAKIAQSGRYVFYDADARSADAIRTAAGKMAIGISAAQSNAPGESLIIPLHNEHMRLSAFGEKTQVIAGTDSFLGVALILFRKAQFVFPADGRWTNPLAQWSRRLTSDGNNLGIKFDDVPVLQSADQMLLVPIEIAVNAEAMPPPYSRLKRDVLESIDRHANDIVQMETQLGDRGGVVIFGSAKVDPRSAPLTYDISYAFGRQGLRGTSGGAGGTMWVVNAGFFDAGAESVGLPIVGRNQLAAETTVHTDVQTHSIGTPGYHVRVYGLLRNQGLIAIAPGGGGTMRELAATLLLFSASPTRGKLVAFIHDGYNRELIDMLLAMPLPRAFRHRVIRSLTPESVGSVSQRLFSSFGVERPAKIPEPRSLDAGFESRF